MNLLDGLRGKIAVIVGGGMMNSRAPLATPSIPAVAAPAASGGWWNKLKGKGMGGKGMLLMTAAPMLMNMFGGGQRQQAPPMQMPMQPRMPMPQMRMPTPRSRGITMPGLGSVRQASKDPDLSDLLALYKEK